jgi:hypothetical protein
LDEVGYLMALRLNPNVMSPEQARVERDRQRAAARQDYVRALEAFKLRRELEERERQPAGTNGSQGDARGTPIPTDEFWELFRLAVEEDASARELARLTDERPDFAFVNRVKTGRITTWVQAHRKRARKALDRHELPREFAATPAGVFPPKS